jgi:hypothetical protein
MVRQTDKAMDRETDGQKDRKIYRQELGRQIDRQGVDRQTDRGME